MGFSLHDYQAQAKDFLITHPKAGLFLDVGFGKTLTTLAALQELGMRGMISGHILIIAPKAIARSTWIDEMAKWGIRANTVSLIVNDKGKQLSRAKRIERYEGIATHNPAFYFINRDLIADLVKWHADNKKPWPFPTIVVDELQAFKSSQSSRFKALKAVANVTKRFIGLTGTPTPNGLEDLWAEIYLMDQGQRLGPNITYYRNMYFNPGLIVNNRPVSWRPKIDAEDIIYNLVSDIVISVRNPNIKLPEVTYNDIVCHMSDEEMKLYKELAKEKVLDLMMEDGGEASVEAQNAAILSAKLSQMASGALYLEKGKSDYVKIHERKLEMLNYIIDNNNNSPVLVAYHFQSDLAEITRYLKEIYAATKDPRYICEVFDGSPEMIHKWNQGQIPVMLLQPASAGHGINIQDGGHTLVWYTLPWSLEHYIQTCGRLNRQGQKHPVVIHHLIMDGTIDRKIMKVLNDKDASEKALLDAVAITVKELAQS